MAMTVEIKGNKLCIEIDLEKPTLSTLEIEFTSGFIYQYFGVPFHLFSGLMFAESKGEFFDRFIRKARYSYRQVW